QERPGHARRLARHRSIRRRRHEPRVFGERARPVPRLRRLDLPQPTLDLGRGELDVEAALLHVDAHDVAVAEDRDGPAVRGLARHVPAHEAVRCARATPSGASCPIMKPCVAPEKRPSVINATESPRPAPCSAPVTCSISRIPGPPFGPSHPMTMTWPGLTLPFFTAEKASSSRSNTIAGPRCDVFVWPETLATQPSGARLPRRIAMPPYPLRGWARGRITF